MANDFKSFSKSNIAIDSGTYSTVYTVPYTATDVEAILLEVDIANTHASNDITVDVKVNKNSGGTGGTDDIFVVKNAPVPVGGALKVVSGQKIVLMSTSTGVDTVTVAASAASSADCIVSVLEDV
ncbi:uncharacterized protein METZ01_LOCUS133184 [marine metagenome]|uniref:Uncharacterized protein n=1 Tax=marine metagenome TaxID=408172 RepID=A0A381YTQ4_9ZZZZ